MKKADIPECRVHLLIADAEPARREFTAAWLESEGYRVVTASDAEKMPEELTRKHFDILIADISLKAKNIRNILEYIGDNDPDTAALIVLNDNSVPAPFDLMKNSDISYLYRPFEAGLLNMRIQSIIGRQLREREYLFLKQSCQEHLPRGNITGSSELMKKRFELIQDIGATDSAVLIFGERGTGRTSAARAVHARSPRARFPFVIVNFAAISDPLTERKLFGCQKGASQDASENEKGLLELARGGTLFLKEVANAPDRIQADLLSVLKNGFFYRVGGVQRVEADFRIMASTCKDLETQVMKRRFREDFYMRLNAVSFEMPLLRECKEDIPLLAEQLVRYFAQERGRPGTLITEEAMSVLIHYPWPGNRHELANALERAVMVSSRGKILPEDLPVCIPEAKGCSVKKIEKDHILQVLEEHRWNIAKSARLLEIDRSTLYNKIKRYGLEIKRNPA